MPVWKWRLVAGLLLAFVGAAIITFAAGVRGVLPNRYRTKVDVWVWRGAFGLIALGTALQAIGTILSP